MSEDTKWWIRTLFIFLTFAILLYTLYYRFGNRGLDTATGSRRNWVAKRLNIYMQNYNKDKYLFNDPDLHDLTDNAENYRQAREYIARGYGTYRCPWGANCPALVNKLVDEEGNTIDKSKPISAEEHARYAYNATLQQIEARAMKRMQQKREFDIIVDDGTRATSIDSYVKKLTSSDIAAGNGSYRIVSGSIRTTLPSQNYTAGAVFIRGKEQQAKDTTSVVVFRINDRDVQISRQILKDSDARFIQVESFELVNTGKIGFYERSPTPKSRLLLF